MLFSSAASASHPEPLLWQLAPYKLCGGAAEGDQVSGMGFLRGSVTAGLTPLQGEPVISLGTLTLVPYHTSLRHCSVCQSREAVLVVLLWAKSSWELV